MKNEKFTLETKIKAVQNYLENKMSGKEIAIKYNFPKHNPSYVYTWTKIVISNKMNYDALKTKIKASKFTKTQEETKAKIISLKTQLKELQEKYSSLYTDSEF